jgi:hypothetical protein
MTNKIFSYIFLVVGFAIALGAFGHGSAAANVHAALDRFTVDSNVASMIYVVWYFVSGCMLVFGSAVIWIWFRLRAGDRNALPVAVLIGALYVLTGVGGMIYRHGDPFMAVFIALGGLLLLSCFVLRKGIVR